MITFELFTDRPVSKVNSHAKLEKVFQLKKSLNSQNLIYIIYFSGEIFLLTRYLKSKMNHEASVLLDMHA